MKRNKIRYKVNIKEKILIILTGKVYLQYRDEEELLEAKKGDLMLWPQNDALCSTRQGDYEGLGFSGYFKVDVHDGKAWQPVILTGIFDHHEHHFAKTERPLDTFALCADTLSAFTGKALRRTYREHYELDE